jgi:signal transduction histidine kinase
MTKTINTKQEAESSLQADFNKAFPPFIIYLATIIILLSFTKDLSRVGFNPYWLMIRVGYLPYILIFWEIAKRKLQSSFYEIPLWAAGLYITCFCTYFSFSTGGLKSDYIFGLLQLYFAIALMPITAITFYMTTFFSIAIYVGVNLYEFGLSNLPDRVTSSTLIPLLVFSIVVYIINSKIRKEKLELQNTLFLTIKKRDEVIRKQSKELAAIETKGALGTLAAQVAHDIRSPLAALNILTSQGLTLPEQSRILVRNVTNRIRDIANDLVEKNRDLTNMVTTVDDFSIQLLAAVIYPLITEKRLQFRSQSKITIEFELSSENYGLFAKINVSEFKRMLSNLINNAVEALSVEGTVLIKLIHQHGNIQLIISDDGKGIPNNILDKLGAYGVSYDKKTGSGLGLYHAKNMMVKLDGTLQLTSEFNKGTCVTLTFPQAPIPVWFLPTLELYPSTTLVILDDDISIHQFWDERFKKFKSNIKIINFTDPIQFHEWQSHSQKSYPILYLFDLELFGHSQTGLKLIEKYQLQKNSVLVTSHSEEKDIHAQCEKLNVKMIPKDIAAFIPIRTLD